MKLGQVTWDDILLGRSRKPQEFISETCPVLRAIKRIVPNCTSVSQSGYVIREGKIPIPEIVKNWITAFDTKQEVFPFVFELDVPN